LYNILIIIDKVFHSKCSNTFMSYCMSSNQTCQKCDRKHDHSPGSITYIKDKIRRNYHCWLSNIGF